MLFLDLRLYIKEIGGGQSKSDPKNRRLTTRIKERKEEEVPVTHLEVPDLFSHHPDPVEPEEEGDEGGQLVHHIGNLRQLVVAQVQHLQLRQIHQGVGQGGQGVLRQAKGLQVHQAANLRGKGHQFVAVGMSRITH